MNKAGTFTQGFKKGRKIKRTKYQNLDDLQSEFPFSLNPSDKPNHAQA